MVSVAVKERNREDLERSSFSYMQCQVNSCEGLQHGLNWVLPMQSMMGRVARRT
jgi:hypothetical protein